jgi:hypothetical protein
MSKLETNTVDSISGTSTLTLGGSNASVVSAGTEVRSNKLSPATGTALQIGDSGDTITIPSGATIVNSGTQTGFGGTNTPFTTVRRSDDQTLSHGSETKILFDAVINESSSNIFDLTNDKFTVATAGTYLILPQLRFYDPENRLYRSQLNIKKNGTTFKSFIHYDQGYSGNQSREMMLGSGFLETLSANDYLEMYSYVETADSGTILGESDHYGISFGIMKIIT